MKGRSEQKVTLVSNPGKQYTHQLVYAFQKFNIPCHFYTSFWYKPGNFPFSLLRFLPKKLRGKFEKEFRKRSFEKINEESVKQWPLFEIVRELSDKLLKSKFSERFQFLRDRLHDRWVASRLNNYYSMVIGYEEASILTFRKAKKLGIITVLDLAQIHYKDIEELACRFPPLASLFKNKKLRKRINKIKEEELQLADYIICLSKFAKNSLIENGVSAHKIFVVNLGFDPEKFFAKKNYYSTGKLKVIYTGTLTKRKGIDVLLKAHKELKDKMDLILVGPEADAKDLINTHTELISVYPYVDQEKLNELLAQADLFVFPSYLDSWGMVAIEAMATGLPVIISDKTGVSEIVSLQAGFCIPAGDLKSLTEGISYFYTQSDKLKTMGEEARNIAIHYTWNRYHQQIKDIIERVNDK